MKKGNECDENEKCGIIQKQKRMEGKNEMKKIDRKEK